MRKFILRVPDESVNDVITDLDKYSGISIQVMKYEDEVTDEILNIELGKYGLHAEDITRKKASIHAEISSLTYNGVIPDEIEKVLNIVASAIGADFQEIFSKKIFTHHVVFVFDDRNIPCT